MLSFQSAKLKNLAHFFGALPHSKSLFLPAERQRGPRRKILVFPGGNRINKCYVKFKNDRTVYSLPNRITRVRLGDTGVSLLKCITKGKKG